MGHLLVRGAYVWPGPGGDPIRDGAVACADDRIVAIGSYADLKKQYPDAAETGNADALVLPGLINAHHHGRGVDAFSLGTADDSLEVYLAGRSGQPVADAYWDTLWAAANLIARGVTTVVHFQTTRNPAQALADATARLQAWQDAGIRVAFGLDLRQTRFLTYGADEQFLAGLPGKLADALRKQEAGRRVLTTDEYFELFAHLQQTYADHASVRCFMAPTGPQWVTDETLAAVGSRAKELGIPLHMHTVETPYQKVAAERLYGRSLVSFLHAQGMLGPGTTLVHGVWLTEADIALLAETRTNVIHNPGANLRLRSGIGPVPQLVKAGVNVALGTDGLALGDDDLLAEARLAFNLHRLPGVHGPAVTQDDVLAMMTSNAAAVTPFGDDIGRLRVGALADLTVIDGQSLAQPFIHPDVRPLDLLIHRGSGRHVLATVVGGKVVAERGQPVGVDLAAIAEQLRSRMQESPPSALPPLGPFVREFYADWWHAENEVPHWPRNGSR